MSIVTHEFLAGAVIVLLALIFCSWDVTSYIRKQDKELRDDLGKLFSPGEWLSSVQVIDRLYERSSDWKGVPYPCVAHQLDVLVEEGQLICAKHGARCAGTDIAVRKFSVPPFNFSLALAQSSTSGTIQM